MFAHDRASLTERYLLPLADVEKLTEFLQKQIIILKQALQGSESSESLKH